jgi:hypothetical protein
MTITLDLTPDLQNRLSVAAAAQGITPSELAVKVLDETLSDARRREEAIALLRSWRDQGNAEQQRETMEFLINALDEDRTSERKLFPPELKGISW